MPLKTLSQILGILSKVPPEVVTLVVDVIKGLAGSKSKDEAARRTIAIASKAASEAALRKALK
jgi:hypothetical protein